MKHSDDNDTSRKSFIKGRADSLRNAARGMWQILRHEKNFRIHLLVLAAVIVSGIFFRFTWGEWIAVVLASGLVLAGECINTAVEYMGDAISEKKNKNIRRAKDASAAGVLIAAAIAVITGILVFITAIVRFFRSG